MTATVSTTPTTSDPRLILYFSVDEGCSGSQAVSRVRAAAIRSPGGGFARIWTGDAKEDVLLTELAAELDARPDATLIGWGILLPDGANLKTLQLRAARFGLAIPHRPVRDLDEEIRNRAAPRSLATSCLGRLYSIGILNAFPTEWWVIRDGEEQAHRRGDHGGERRAIECKMQLIESVVKTVDEARPLRLTNPVPKDAFARIRDAVDEMQSRFTQHEDGLARVSAMTMSVGPRDLPGESKSQVDPSQLQTLSNKIDEVVAAVREGSGTASNTSTTTKLPKIKPWAPQAWMLKQTGRTTTEIAVLLSRELRDSKITQPRVSEQIKLAVAHVEASGFADKFRASLRPEGGRAPARTLDPTTAERGARTDGRARYLVERQRQVSKDGDDEN